MTETIHKFNARYRDDIYGVLALELNEYYLCIINKYHVALIYRNGLKDDFENKLKSDELFCNDFLNGSPVRLFK